MTIGLEEQFRVAMQERYSREIPKATGYRATRMIEMVERYGGVETVRTLMREYAHHASDGYTKLWMEGRLDLSFEALMREPRFRE